MTSTDATVRLAAYDCLTALGDARRTHAALLRGQTALQRIAVLGREGGDAVPLALLPGRALDETVPPAWLPALKTMVQSGAGDGWGGPRRPVFVTSSNFGVGSLYAHSRGGDAAHLQIGSPARCMEWLRLQMGWGANVTVYSHACVSAHLGLLQAARMLAAGTAEEALVCSFDFLSPFVTGGFHALKILNANFPAPYTRNETGSIGLGDGAAFAVLTKDRGEFELGAQNLYNEMHHYTANRADGTGFADCLQGLSAATQGKRLWLKGHGTGTLEAGELEVAALAQQFPQAPLVGWKGALGHTLGSCGLVELAIAMETIRAGTAPGTIGAGDARMAETVAADPIDLRDRDAVVCASNAFGGAHAALVLQPAKPAPAATRPAAAAPWVAERYIQAAVWDDAGVAEIAVTRDRLRDRFPPRAVRRMTHLGLLVGAVLQELEPSGDETLVYATGYGEARALEDYLHSFPTASPTLFQTSIHPSGVQQALIGRQRSVREVFPLSGEAHMPASALLTAWHAPSERVLVCGGEERGAGLRELGLASERSFAFALALTRSPGDRPLACLRLSPTNDAAGHCAIEEFFDALVSRRAGVLPLAPGWQVELSWT
jgi:hypothetical protein